MPHHLPRRPLLPPFAALLLTAVACQHPTVRSDAPAPVPLTYPEARICDQVDVYHGVEVADPYRWLEGDPDTPEIKTWIEAENRLTRSWLDAIPERDAILARLTELWNTERVAVPTKRGERLFYLRNDGLQNQAVLWVVDGPGQAPRVLLDPNTLSADGTVALSDVVPSPGGRLLAYGLSDGGSDWRTWHFMDVASGKKLDDVLEGNKFGGVDWTEEAKGVVYTRFPRPREGEELRELNTAATICWHRLGTPQTEDEVLSPALSEEGVSQWAGVTSSRRAVLVLREKASTDTHEISVISLAGESRGRVVDLITGFDAQYVYVGNTPDTMWFRTNLDAPRWRIIAIDLEHPERENWREVISECEETMVGADIIGGHLVATYLRDATSEVRVHDMDGKFVRRVELPGLGSARGFEGEADDPVTFYSFTNQVTPHVIYRYDVSTDESEVFHAPKLLFRPDDYEVRQVFYESKDGTRIPMFLSHKKGLVRNGANPTYLYGYGGFNISLTPAFYVDRLAWMEMGGLLAVPNLRGGGEYGEAWHRAGTKTHKQNVFDDFIAAAEWLIANDYTSTPKLAIGGGSNGGLLVGACLTQRPDLFGAALPAVGVMDMLRFHLFTIGWAWAGDYGTSDDPEQFAALLKYSPLHNIEDGTAYPATLVTTADRDDRVVPAHSFKFAARLQAAQGGDAPVLIRIGTRAGHGAGKPTTMRIEEAADRLAFLVHVLGV